MAVGGSIVGDLIVTGNVVVSGGLQQSGAASVTPANMTLTPISGVYRQVRGSAIVADTGQDLIIVGGSTGNVKRVNAAITGAIATDVSRTVNVDVQKSTGGAAFATILSSTIPFGNTDTLRTSKAGTLTGTISLVAGDILQVVVTVAGAVGNQAQGLVVTVDIQEAP